MSSAAVISECNNRCKRAEDEFESPNESHHAGVGGALLGWPAIVPHLRSRLWSVAAVLTAPAVSAWAAQTYFGAALSAGAIKLSARQVGSIPLPDRPWDAAAAALAEGDVDRCARLMDDAYATDVYPWWRGGLTRRSR